MNFPDETGLFDPAAARLVKHLQRKGIKLRLDNGQLRYQAVTGAMTQQDLHSLRESKESIIAFLEKQRMNRAEPALLPSESNVAPLSFSQQSHLHLHQLFDQGSTRIVTAAIRLHEALDYQCLQWAVDEMMLRHEALRTRVVMRDGIPMQQTDRPARCQVEMHDLSALDGEQQLTAIRNHIDDAMFAKINVTADPLFAVKSLQIGLAHHVLILAMDHMISDGVSRSILLRDLLAAYAQLRRGLAVSLPPIPIQFADYALWQRQALEHWRQTHGAYWQERLISQRALALPLDETDPAALSRGIGRVPVRIDSNLKGRLEQWCRAQQTTLVMGVFTAFTALILRWCHESSAVIQYQTDGRVRTEIQNTVGYFAFRLHVCVRLDTADTFLDLLRRNTQEYCNAHEHADFGYLETLTPRPEFTQGVCFNWLGQDLQQDDARSPAQSSDTIAYSRIPFEHTSLNDIEMEGQLIAGFLEGPEEVRGWLQFPLKRFSSQTMQTLGANLAVFIEAMLRAPGQPVRTITLPR